MAKLKTVTVTRQKVEQKNISPKLKHAAHVAMADVIGLKENEEVLITTNFGCDGFIIAKALYDATISMKGKPVVVVQEKKNMFDFAERLVLETMRAEPDIVISVPSYVGGKDPYGVNIGYVGRDGKKYQGLMTKLMDGDKRIRGFWSPQVTVDMFERCVPIDYASMYKTAGRLANILNKANEVKITTPSGTDTTISIKGRKAMGDDRPFNMPGIGGNLPCGEVFISPTIEGVSGTIMFDGTINLDNGSVIPKKPVKVTMKNGYVDQVTGGEEAKMLLNVIKKGEAMAHEKGAKDLERNARHIGELGIGLNPAAKMTGNLLEDEKIIKTIHLAIGNNYDNDANALIHQDCLIIEPDMWVDGKPVMKKGKLLL